MSRLNAFLAFLVITLIACVTYVQPTPAASPSIEGLRDHDGHIHCTVFSINEREHLWLTAHHCTVVSEGSSTQRENFIGYDAAPVFKDFAEIDAAILRTTTASAPAMRLASIAPEVGDTVYLSGHGLGWEVLTKFIGKVAATHAPNPDTPELYTIFDMHVFPGHSGSPVTNAHGDVISIMQDAILGVSAGVSYEDLVRATGAYWRR
jgi:hypothetical protein